VVEALPQCGAVLCPENEAPVVRERGHCCTSRRVRRRASRACDYVGRPNNTAVGIGPLA
jgi:hypothetical protein